MPGKRSHYKRTLNLVCPKCGLKLLKLSRQGFLSYKEPGKISELCDIPLATVRLIAMKSAITKKDARIGKFYCIKDGLQWLEVWRSDVDNSIHFLPLTSLCTDSQTEWDWPEPT